MVVGRRVLVAADEQGTLVQFRDGPAAVTERFEPTYLKSHCRRGRCLRQREGWIGSVRESEDLPPLNRAAVREGRTLSNRHPRPRKRVAGLFNSSPRS